MDSHRFDAFTRRLATGLSRRASLELLATLGLFGLTSPAATAAKKKKRACPPCKGRKKGKCKKTLPDGAACAGGTCRAGSCVTCTASCGQKACGDDGCGGSCGTCGEGQVCSSGQCCPTGYTSCQGQCVDLSDNPNHCGVCATVCSAGKTCCGGRCVNLLDDDDNCAGCGVKCLPDPTADPPQGAICVNGTCLPCALEGNRGQEPPLRCCRGLVPCQDPMGAFNKCIPVGAPCP